jgi:hypothetical protein
MGEMERLCAGVREISGDSFPNEIWAGQLASLDSSHSTEFFCEIVKREMFKLNN